MVKQILVMSVLIVAAACGSGGVESPAPSTPPAPTAPAPEPVPTAESAAATLRGMLDVAREGDWGRYVDVYYGETHKFGSPADRDALVARFEGQWGERVVEALGRAVDATPRIEDGRAVFEVDGVPAFELHADERGGWKFHL